MAIGSSLDGQDVDLSSIYFRKGCKPVDPPTQDFTFDLLDVTFSQYPKNVYVRKDEKTGKELYRKEDLIYLHGVTDDARTTCVVYQGYRPYFYLSLPDEADSTWRDQVILKLRNSKANPSDDEKGQELKWEELCSLKFVEGHPTVGFRAGVKMKFLKFEFFTNRMFQAFKKVVLEEYPLPTKSEILKGIYRNDYVVCEHKLVEEMKFLDWADIKSAASIKLPAGTYTESDDVSTAHYNWTAESLTSNEKKTKMAPVYVDSIDIEAIRQDGLPALPEATTVGENKKGGDVIATIGHAIHRSDRKGDVLYIVWTWVAESTKVRVIKDLQTIQSELLQIDERLPNIQLLLKTLKAIKEPTKQMLDVMTSLIQLLGFCTKHKEITWDVVQEFLSEINNDIVTTMLDYDITTIKPSTARKIYAQFNGSPDSFELNQKKKKKEKTTRMEAALYLVGGWIKRVTRNTLLTEINHGKNAHAIFPTHEDEPDADGKLKAMPRRNIIVMEYNSEAEMLNKWATWWTNTAVSSDVVIGWNILGFDLGYIKTRMDKLCGIEEDSHVWGRLKKQKTMIKRSAIASRAISHHEYKQTPSAGRVFLDDQIIFQREVMLRLLNYKLETVAQHFLGQGKSPIRYTQIKGFFYGSVEERGGLFWYNIQDCYLVLELFFMANHWAKSVSVARVNRTLLNLLCTRGQQVRVMGGLHYIAVKNGYIVYRPHYHPVLDNPIYEEEDDGDEISEAKEPPDKDNNNDINNNNNNNKKDKLSDDQTSEIMALLTGKGAKYETPVVKYDFDTNDVIDRDLRMFKRKGFKPHFTTTKYNEDTGQVEEVDHKELNNLSNVKLSNPKKRDADSMMSKDDGFGPNPQDRKFVQPKRIDLKNCKTADGRSPADILKALSSGKSGGKRPPVDPTKRVNYTVRGTFDDMITGRNQNVKKSPNKSPIVNAADIIKAGKNKLNIDDVLASKRVQSSKTASTDEPEDNAKGFSGGYVMSPDPGIYYNIIILDFNSLYPNLMLTHFLDPALLVLDDKYYQPSKYKYLNVYFNRETVYRYAQNLPGIIIQHTRNLVASRKVSQGAEGAYAARVDRERLLLIEWLGTKKAKLDDVLAEAKAYVSSKRNSGDDAAAITQDVGALIYLNAQRLEAERKDLEDIVKGINKDQPKHLEDIDELLEFCEQYVKLEKADAIKQCIIEQALECIRCIKEALAPLVEKCTTDPSMKVGSVVAIEDILALLADHQRQTSNFNAEQNEKKVGANSTFGFTGAGKIIYSLDGKMRSTGLMTARPVSATVTFLGRQSIEVAKTIAERKVPGSKVRYIDTDSIFWDALLPNTHEGFLRSFDLGDELADEITKHPFFTKDGDGTSSMKIVREKIARAIVFYSAKCYALLKHLNAKDPGKVEIKGLQFTKRDCCKFANVLGRTVVDMLLKESTPDKAMKYVQEELMKLVNRTFKNAKDYDDVSISTKITKGDYGSVSVPGHVKLAKRMDVRSPGLGPKSGESVKYIYYYNNPGDVFKQKSMDEHIEDFEYSIENNIKVDLLWYLENQIKKTVTTVFAPIMPNPEILLEEAIGLQMNKQLGGGKKSIHDVAASIFGEDGDNFPSSSPFSNVEKKHGIFSFDSNDSYMTY